VGLHTQFSGYSASNATFLVLECSETIGKSSENLWGSVSWFGCGCQMYLYKMECSGKAGLVLVVPVFDW
jgi:hypothetical protein